MPSGKSRPLSNNDLPFPQAILFDWDSTLVDGWDSVVAGWNAALAELGKPPMSRDEAIRRAGIPPTENFMGVFGETWQQGKSRFYEEVGSPASLDRLKILPGTETMLETIADWKIPMAVISNKNGSNLVSEIEHLGWQKYFFTSVGGGDAAYDKPHPAPILFALQAREISPSPDVWMVGDMQSDIEAACRAGVTAILIETTNALGLGLEGDFRTHKPHSRVKDASAFLELVRTRRDTIS